VNLVQRRKNERKTQVETFLWLETVHLDIFLYVCKIKIGYFIAVIYRAGVGRWAGGRRGGGGVI
jgi:hypothetical protein